jgi:hypothetical protein
VALVTDEKKPGICDPCDLALKVSALQRVIHDHADNYPSCLCKEGIELLVETIRPRLASGIAGDGVNTKELQHLDPLIRESLIRNRNDRE